MDVTKLQKVVRRRLPRGFWFEGLFSDGTTAPIRKQATRPYEVVAVHTGSYKDRAIGYLTFHTTPKTAIKSERSYGDWEVIRYVAVTDQELVWGGQLLGWTTQAEVNALDESIKTDY